MKKALLGAFLLAGATVFAQTTPTLVDFEAVAPHAPSEGATVDNAYYLANYGVSFHMNTVGSAVLPRYAAVGGSTPAAFVIAPSASYSTTKGTTCNGYFGPYDNPKNTALDEGCFFITDDVIGTNPLPNTLVVDYVTATCNTASGYLLDVDGAANAEGWQINAYVGGVLNNTIYIVSDQWTSCTACPTIPPPFNTPAQAGDGAATFWQITTSGGNIDYLEFIYIGNPARNVGVAFDEFFFCSTPPPLDCETTSSFDFEVQGCKVNFFNASTSNSVTDIIGYHWTFGDGATSNEENPTHFYSAPGVYTVCLKVTGFDGKECCISEFCTEVGIEEECQRDCEAEIDFRWTQDEECNPCTFEFDAILNFYTTPVLGYFWDFGDGSTATGPNPVHTFAPGSYTVCLTIVFEGPDGECCVFTVCQEISCGEGKQAAYFDPEDEGIGLNNAYVSEQETSVLVYPNPVRNEISMEMQLDRAQRVSVQIVSVSGQVVFEQQDLSMQEGPVRETWNVGDLTPGIYLMRIDGEHFQHTQQISVMD